LPPNCYLVSSDLGSEYRLSNVLGHGAAIDLHHKSSGVIGVSRVSAAKSFLERDIRVGPAHKRCAHIVA